MPTRTTSSPPSGHLDVRVEDGLAHVRLARPDKLNALTLGMLDDLVGAARLLRRVDGLRAVVVSGAGDAFCAGLDLGSALAQPVGIAHRFVPRPWWGTNVFQEACWGWRRLPVPVVAAVHGHCLGAGLQLALGADARVSTPDAQWSVRETRWGLVPDMSGAATLRELVPADVAKELTLTARTLTGAEAARLGLVTRVAEDAVAGAVELARELSVHDRAAVAAGKRLLTPVADPGSRRVLARERRLQLRLLARLATSDRSRLPGSARPPG
ncbi:crotonase/enoyl-CoA hydratase family protein [Ornithinimicrobium flavum]|uniref:crotonase/enoyl-CoA hydratase family protein n=1 Tax=Ornithinimicrobium flavum TaxID=1288636 RepID=UPI00106F3DA1|nr:crotonase/enoyl-CoA hydratase family protein [Ornithinimicrobium flavum]